ncbi:MAG: caspase family protein [Afipia sp.]|nr:caspase family protein [Afipia sp.]
MIAAAIVPIAIGNAAQPVTRTIGVSMALSGDEFTDTATGVKVRIPVTLFAAPKLSRYGRTWDTPDRQISVDTLNLGNTETLESRYSKLIAVKNRALTKKFIDKTKFVLEGREFGKRSDEDTLFHMEAEVNNGEVRAFSIFYPPTMQQDRAAMVRSIIGSADLFPSRVEVAVHPQTAAPAPASPSDLVVRQSPSGLSATQDQIADQKFDARRAEIDKAAQDLARQQQDINRRAGEIAAAAIAKSQQADDVARQLDELRKQNEDLTKRMSEILKTREMLRPSFGGNRVALVLGNNAYPNLPADRQLAKAVSDSRTMGNVLQQVGFKVTRGENLDRTGMSLKIYEFLQQVKTGDMAVVFYAGHGLSFDGGNYLLPTDIRIPEPNQEGLTRTMSIAETEIIGELQKRKVDVAVIVLDACRENPFRRPGMTRALGVDQGLTTGSHIQGVFSIYSAGMGQSALDSLGPDDKSPNSVFTRVMSSELYRDAPLTNIMPYVKQEVTRLAESVNHVQNPAYYDETRGGFLYVAAPALPGAAKGVGGPVEQAKN